MKKNTIRFIIIITAISLLGLILMQLFWIHNALKLSGDQFDHRVTIALKDVLSNLLLYNQNAVEPEKNESYVACPKSKNPQTDFIHTDVLDSLLKANFLNQNVDTVFEYAIVAAGADSPLYEKKGVITDSFPVSCHTTGLSCIFNSKGYQLEVYFPDKQMFILLEVSVWLLVSIIFLLIVVVSFTYIVITIMRQKKLSEMKNDFINNMTHEFKTPISTISMATEVLMKADPPTSSERIKKYSKVIFEENQRLKMQVERVLEAAEMDRDSYKIKYSEKIDLHQLIKDTVDNLCLEQCDKEVVLTYDFKAEIFEIAVDRLHFSNVINNLVDNAYKYCTTKPVIEISTKNTSNGIVLSVKDNGPGMNADTQKQIFNKFYRKPTGNLHDVKGFGLGLFYVRNIVEKHGGEVKVASSPGNGSRFDVFLPFKFLEKK